MTGNFKDPFYSKNLWDIPSSLFAKPWTYRTTFSLPSTVHERGFNKAVCLHFLGLNYKANIWLNHHKIGNTDAVVGTFRYFDFVLPFDQLRVDGENELEVEIYRPNDHVFPPNNNSTDLALTFVDWAPPPPDSSMGLWRDVYISVSGPVVVQYPLVNSIITDDLRTAYLTILAELSNYQHTTAQGILEGEIQWSSHSGHSIVSFQQPVTIKPNQTLQIFFDHRIYPQLVIPNPPLWWPWQMGQPLLHNLTLRVIMQDTNGKHYVGHSLTTRFGIRQITSELDHNQSRLYRVNGKPILIRGAGWAPDLFLREPREWLHSHFVYVRDMNLNTIRLEGKMDDDYFFELADEFGILTMPGWCCCDAWQHWPAWTPQTYRVAAESLRSQVKRLRIHPSVLVFLYSSDELPPLDVEKLYLYVFKQEAWPNPVLSTASNYTSPITGPSGVKMSGPYSWVPPVYWLEGADQRTLGGAFGFLTEGGPGENPLTYESLLRTIPASEMWPINSFWDAHCGNPAGLFYDLRFFTPPLNARYGNTLSAYDYLEKAQVAVYETHRAMFEAYSRNKYTSTGLIQWMLNNAFPEMIWHLYDYYFTPSASYFATKKACEPLHVMYSYNDASVWVINSLYEVYVRSSPVVVWARIFDIHANLLYEANTHITSVPPDSSSQVMKLPRRPKGASTTYFVSLQLFLAKTPDEIISDNFYWLSTQQDVLEWDKSTFYRTPCSSYADLTLLSTLPPVALDYTPTWSIGAVKVRITNPSPNIAFFIRLRVVQTEQSSPNEQKEVLPIIWEDNYFSLLPHQTKTIGGSFDARQLNGSQPSLIVEVFNNKHM